MNDFAEAEPLEPYILACHLFHGSFQISNIWQHQRSVIWQYPCLSKIMFSGLISRWIMLLSCKYFNPYMIHLMMNSGFKNKIYLFVILQRQNAYWCSILNLHPRGSRWFFLKIFNSNENIHYNTLFRCLVKHWNFNFYIHYLFLVQYVSSSLKLFNPSSCVYDHPKFIPQIYHWEGLICQQANNV